MAALCLQPGRYAVAGFTLVELMITVAVGAILLTAAVPSYRSFITDQRVKTAS
jgi:type IV fimbrial biogenesis protein FimT